MRIESFNCGRQVYSCYPEITRFIEALWELKLPVAEGYAKYPAHNPIFNAMMDMVGDCLDWTSQPFVMTEKPRIVTMRGDLSKQMGDGLGVFVEIEIGNEASVFRDLVKFDVAGKLETYDFFIFVLPGPRAASKLGYAMDFDSFIRKRDFFKQFISVPLIVVEIEPQSEFDLTRVVSDPTILSGRWGMEMSKNFIVENNLKSELGIL